MFLGLHFSSSAPHCSIRSLFSIPASWAGSRDMQSCSKRSSWLDSQCSHPPAFKLSTAVAFLSLLHRCPSLCLALCINHITLFSQQSFPSQIFILHFLCAKGIQSKGCSNEQKAGNPLSLWASCSLAGEHLFKWYCYPHF